MSAPKLSPVSIAIDLALCLGFGVFMYTIVSPHVPSRDPNMIHLWGGLAAACMTGVFWLCIQMFRAVARGQAEARRN